MNTKNRGLLDTAWNSVTESQAWRSIFRHGYPDTPLNQSLVMMGNVFLHLHPVKVSRKAMKVTYTWCLGGLSFFLFLVLTITGGQGLTFVLETSSGLTNPNWAPLSTNKTGNAPLELSGIPALSAQGSYRLRSPR